VAPILGEICVIGVVEAPKGDLREPAALNYSFTFLEHFFHMQSCKPATLLRRIAHPQVRCDPFLRVFGHFTQS